MECDLALKGKHATTWKSLEDLKLCEKKKKPVTKGQILYDSIYTLYPE